MSAETKQLITKLAWKTRLWAEQQALRNSFFSWKGRTDLGGMCAIASAHLFNALTKAGLQAKLRAGFNHVFVTTNGYLVDVTATQFGIAEKVVIRKYNEVITQPKVPDYWRPCDSFTSIDELVNFQQESNWPEYQIVK